MISTHVMTSSFIFFIIKVRFCHLAFQWKSRESKWSIYLTRSDRGTVNNKKKHRIDDNKWLHNVLCELNRVSLHSRSLKIQRYNAIFNLSTVAFGECDYNRICGAVPMKWVSSKWLFRHDDSLSKPKSTHTHTTATSTTKRQKSREISKNQSGKYLNVSSFVLFPYFPRCARLLCTLNQFKI